MGHHEAVLAATDPENLSFGPSLLLSYVLKIYLASALFPKLVILAIYLRISPKAPYRIACWALAVLLITNWVGTTLAGFLSCISLEFWWDRSIPDGRRFNINSYFRWAGLNNIFTDVIMLILPLPVIWKLKIATNIKIGLTFTFAAGSM